METGCATSLKKQSIRFTSLRPSGSTPTNTRNSIPGGARTGGLAPGMRITGWPTRTHPITPPIATDGKEKPFLPA